MGRAVAFLLTHRRGCALAIWDRSSSITQSSFMTASDQKRISERIQQWAVKIGSRVQFSPDESELKVLVGLEFLLQHPLPQGGFEQGHVSGFSYCVTDRPTAESLSEGYRRVLHVAGLADVDVDELVIAVGPSGSFTGLRIGAAFAGGLQMGRQRTILHFPTVDPGDLEQLAGVSHTAETIESNARSAFSTPVHPRELWFVLASYLGKLLSVGAPEAVRYATLPGPVLLYQKKQGLI